MPYSAPTLCSRPGCTQLSPHSHSRREYDQRRGSSTQRGYDVIWQKRRKRALRTPEGAICRLHWEELGQVVPAHQRDHIVPKAKGGSDDDSNLQSTCDYCNSAKGDMDDAEFRAVLRKRFGR